MSRAAGRERGAREKLMAFVFAPIGGWQCSHWTQFQVSRLLNALLKERAEAAVHAMRSAEEARGAGSCDADDAIRRAVTGSRRRAK